MYDNHHCPANLFQQVTDIEALHRAWRKVRAKRGAAGVDAVSLEAFAAQLAVNLQELSRSLVARTYQPLPARFVTVTKENGQERELAILTVRDRVAQRAVLDAVEPLLEPRLLDCSFAFRAGRNCALAVQRMLAARANGYWWTVESDVQDFFGAIDRRLLLADLAPVLRDKEVLHLLNLWLEGGALEPQDESWAGGWRQPGRETWASLKLLLHDAVGQSVDDLVAEKLGVAGGSWPSAETAPLPDATTAWAEMHQAHEKQTRREAFKRVAQDGAMLAWTQRATVGRVLGAKLLGAGGLAVAAAVLVPKALAAYRQHTQPASLGTLQGAPISPLLTNFYMTPFDTTLTQQGWRLVRYCDDFVIQCRTATEARAALHAAEAAARERRLTLHPEKTRIIPPEGAFAFLGYEFTADGRVIPPATVPEQMARHLKQLAQRAAQWRPRR